MTRAAWRLERKPCAFCGVAFGPHRAHGQAVWAKRRYCSQVCFGLANPRKYDPWHSCEHCGDTYWNDNPRSRFCGVPCWQAHQRGA